VTAIAAPIVRLPRVASTQLTAFELAEAGACDGTAVVALTQTDGRGRRGRRWHDEPGTSLLLSVVVRPTLALAEWPLLSFAGALAVTDMLEAVANLSTRLKWPNDVLVGGRKIAGILLESRTALPAVIVGIGVNLAQRGFPAELTDRATSVALETAREIDREQALTAVLHAFDLWRRRLERQGFAPLRARWRELSDTIGSPVTVEGVPGLAVDLDRDGALIVQTPAGPHRVVAGEIGT
jgi:BirA family biotin operon repressor/biotin-[acetyl-CoA-carboxylase] ligase